MRYFLLVYDPAAEELIVEHEFADQDEAQAAYADVEAEHRGDPVQILLFAADSLETVKQTHPHYFAASGHETAPFPVVS